MYIRLGRGRDPEVYPEVPRDFRIGQAATLRDGKDLTIITNGSMLRATLDAADLLAGARDRGAGDRHAHAQAARCGGDPQGRARDRRPS